MEQNFTYMGNDGLFDHVYIDSGLNDLAVRVNEMYRDYDPFNFEDDMCPSEEIANMIANRNPLIVEDMMEMASNCVDDYEMLSKILNLLTEVLTHY